MIHSYEHIHVAELREHVGETVSVRGWVHAVRRQRVMQFLLVRDGTGVLQVTHRRGGSGGALEAEIEQLSVESAVRVTGKVVDNPVVDLGGLELVPRPSRCSVAPRHRCPSTSTPAWSTGWTGGSSTYAAGPRRSCCSPCRPLSSGACASTRTHTAAPRCTPPKLMGTASESGAEVFRLEYFDRFAYLAQSPQFYKQMAIAAGMDGVFEIGPVFRAEPSFTSRHATEFTGVDVELGWIDGVEDVMAFEERMLAHAFAAVVDAHGAAITERFGVEPTVPEVPFPRMTMAEALEVARGAGWQPGGDRADLDAAGERLVSAQSTAHTGHEFVFVTRFPSSVRPFYHMRPTGRPDLTLSFDLLYNGLEVTTGAQREHRYDVLLAQAAEKGMDTEPLRDYLNCFRFGCPPHGGLGMGLGRLLMAMLGLDSIREATFLFRGPNRLTP